MSIFNVPSEIQTETEMELLGTLLHQGTALIAEGGGIDAVIRVLEPKHFADPVRGLIYEKIRQRAYKVVPFTVLDLRDDFENSRELDEVGGTTYLSQLLAKGSSLQNLKLLTMQVVMAWEERGVVGVCERMSQVAEALSTEFYASHMHHLGSHTDSDLYGDDMLCTVSLDREEVLLLTEHHHEAARRATIIHRTAEKQYHDSRGVVFQRALLRLEPHPEVHQQEVEEAASQVRNPADIREGGEIVGGNVVDMREPTRHVSVAIHGNDGALVSAGGETAEEAGNDPELIPVVGDDGEIIGYRNVVVDLRDLSGRGT